MNKIAAALSITHSAGVLHRDISPDNIMICKDGKIKLIDFGAARQIMAESSSNLTVVMKPGYTPMEQYTKKGRQGAWTDIYALGVSIYYALTETIIDDPYARMDDDEEFRENKHGINNSLWEIIKKCTMINASERYSNAIELRKALSSVSAPVEPVPIVLEDNDINVPAEESSVEDNNNENFESTSPISHDTVNKDPKQSQKHTTDNINTFPVTDDYNDDDDDTDDNDDTDNDDIQNQDLDLSVNVYEDPEKKKRPVSKKALTVIICMATALIIGIIALVTALNINGDKGSQKRNPDALEHLIIDNSNSRWSLLKQISVFTLQEFEGDILVTLNIRTNDTVRNEDGSYYHFISVKDNNENNIKINALNWAEDPNGYYVYDGQKQFTFILPESSIADIYQYIRFETPGLTVSSVELRAYDSSHSDAKAIRFNGEYPGDWQLVDGAVPKKDLESFGGDVMVTLGIEPGRYNDDSEWMWHINTMTDEGEWLPVEITAFNQPAPEPTFMYPVYNGQDQFVFVISREAIEALPDTGLKIQVHNIVVRSAVLEAYNGDVPSASAETEAETEADTSVSAVTDAAVSSDAVITVPAIPDAVDGYLFIDRDIFWSNENKIPTDTLRQFNGDILVTLNIVTTVNSGIAVVDKDSDESKLKINVYNLVHHNNGNACNFEDNLKQYIFILPESSVSDVSEYITFNTTGVVIMSAELRAYDRSASDMKTIQFNGAYPGDWDLTDDSVPKNDLKSFGGDVLVTLDIETGIYGSDEGSECYIDVFKVLDDWERINTTAFNRRKYSPEYMYRVYNGQKQFVFVISREEIEALPEDGLKFQVHNVIVRSASLEAYTFTE